MTDLPYGRGGHPLQNLIKKGHTSTKLTAYRMRQNMDDGEIYLKKDLALDGTAGEIYQRAMEIICDEMIPEIVENDITPVKQVGKPVFFKRFAPEDIGAMHNLKEVFDSIRMSDAPYYDKGYIDYKNLHIEFLNPYLTKECVTANCRITMRDD